MQYIVKRMDLEDDTTKEIWCDFRFCGWNKHATRGGRTEWYMYLCQACHPCACNNFGWLDLWGSFNHMHYFAKTGKYKAISMGYLTY